ncbi:MAG: hypothetical protein ACYDIC_05405 [Desulfobaccales bacterium]
MISESRDGEVWESGLFLLIQAFSSIFNERDALEISGGQAGAGGGEDEGD